MQYLSFSAKLTSLSIIPLGFICVFTNDKILFFFYDWVVFNCIYTTSSLSIHLLMSTDCLHILAIDTTRNIKVQKSLWIGVFFTNPQKWNCYSSQRRQWQPTPVFLPGESQGQGSLVGCRLWGRTQLDTTEAT